MAVDPSTVGLIAIGAGIAVAGGCIGTGIAQAAIGSAGMGVLAEKPEEQGKILFFMVVPETIIIFGFVMGIVLLLKSGLL
jgi:V/A-type H+/Na+-transporting ATPase subunit K